MSKSEVRPPNDRVSFTVLVWVALIIVVFHSVPGIPISTDVFA
jgi:hypothetical protein